MSKVKTIEQAEDWFLMHHSGGVIAVNSKGEEKECFSYPEPEAFIKKYE